MNRELRTRIYLLAAATIFAINLFQLEVGDLTWNSNKIIYINMLVAALVYTGITMLKRKNKN